MHGFLSSNCVTFLEAAIAVLVASVMILKKIFEIFFAHTTHIFC